MRNPFHWMRRSDEPRAAPDQMTLLDHLKELRRRLIRSVTAVFAGFVVAYVFRDRIFNFLREPYCEFLATPEGEQVSPTVAGANIPSQDSCAAFLIQDPLEGFSAVITLVGYGGLILAFPVILYQLGQFVIPGLYKHEKRALFPFLGVAIVLMFLGMTVAYLVLPRALSVLVFDFGFEGFVPFFSPRAYLALFVKMLFAFGIAAQLPVVLVFLQKIGVVQHSTLAKNRRLAAVAVVILGAVITPTGDPFTLGVISIPMYIFYEIAIFIGRRMQGPSPTKEQVGAEQ